MAKASAGLPQAEFKWQVKNAEIMGEDNFMIETGGCASDDLEFNMERLGITQDDPEVKKILQYFENETEKFKAQDQVNMKKQQE